MNYLARPNQPLAVHLNNVSRLTKAFGQVFGAANTASLVGLLHDFGKYTEAFQVYLNNKDGKRGEVIHALQGAKYILEAETIDRPVVAEIIANVIAAHHNGLFDGLSNGEKPLTFSTRDREQLHYAEAKQSYFTENKLPENFEKDIIKETFNICRTSKAKELNPCFMLHLWTKAIYSCLVDADRCDAAGLSGETVVPDWNEYINRLEKYLAGFNNTTQIEQARKRFSEQCGQAGEREQDIYTLSLPTGGGKTLSSLRFALQHAEKHKLKRIIYVIPYLSILDQTAKTIRCVFAGCDMCENKKKEKCLLLKEQEKCEAFVKTYDIILEHHSNIDIPETEEEEEKYKLLTSRWDSPIILTTMVQFLETVYSNRASQLRKFHNMADSVIIFDEVQSLPLKCVYLFNDAVNFLHTFGKTTVLLCTATQPQLNNKELLNVPVILPENSDIVALSDEEKTLFERVKVTPVRNEDGKNIKEFTIEELADFTKSQLEAGKSTLVVLNTKNDARKLYEQCKDFNGEKTLLTTNFCPAHRLEKLEQLREHLKNKRKTLCISTQLIEAGVDISFDCVIRVVAGLDSIVQAGGRGNRNGESKTPQPVYVIKLKGENLDRLLEIEDGQDKTGRVFRDMKNENLLSEAALTLFYKYYFGNDKQGDKERRKELFYPVNDTSIYDLLSVNTLGKEGYRPITDGLPCAFKTAAAHFSVIDKAQTGVVVPYNEEAKMLVRDFQKVYDPKIRVRILQKLQKFTVSVYPYMLEKLGKAVTIVENCFYYLEDNDYYDEEQGLLTVSKLSFKHV